MSFKVDLMPYLNLKVVSKFLANSILWRKKTTFGPFEKDILELMLIKTFSHWSTRLKNGLGLSLPCIDSISQNMRIFLVLSYFSSVNSIFREKSVSYLVWYQYFLLSYKSTGEHILSFVIYLFVGKLQNKRGGNI